MGNFQKEDLRKFVYIQKTLVVQSTKKEKGTEKKIKKTKEANLLPISKSGLIKGISSPLQT
jgi:hypothetical protein